MKSAKTYFVIGQARLSGSALGGLFREFRLPKMAGTARVMDKRVFDRALGEADRKLVEVERTRRSRDAA